MTIPERLTALRALMVERGYDIYIVPSDDFHQSEYVGDYFKARAFITGFTGSAGTAVITKDQAGLWTDGRYFIQASEQLADSGITLYKMGLSGVPTISEFIEQELPEEGTIGFDGRVISTLKGQQYAKIAEKKNGQICDTEDLIDLIWNDRPKISQKSAFALSEVYTGEAATSKLSRIREAMEKSGANLHIVASLDDICWITNLRGQDIEYFPLLLSYAIISMKEMTLYVDKKKLNADIKVNLAKAGIVVRPYLQIYEDIRTLNASHKVLLDPSRVNYRIRNSIPAETSVVTGRNPSVLMKSMKNDTEIGNIKKAHIKDGIAVTRFMYWLKMHVGKDAVTEIDAAEKLEEFRKEQEGYLWQSFDPICASGSHGAIIHYSATEETNRIIENNQLFLTDTGGGYLEGSTDITRTFAFGEVPEYMKADFTSVLLCNLHLADAAFPYGTTGSELDTLARIPLWKRGLDFRHGTGHGVGYLMNIHEEPARISRLSKSPLEAGMVVTDEPGLYVEGSHGIRIENELLVCKGEKTEYGQFIYFQPLTLVPIDLDAVLPTMLSDQDKKLLNTYHKNVYDNIAPYLSEEEKNWLAKYTRAI